MGKSELKDALQRKMNQRCAQLWQEAEGEVAARRAEIAAEIETCRAGMQARLQRESRAVRRQILSAATREAAVLRLQAEVALAVRLRALAAPLLGELYAAARTGYWRQLYAELPASVWQRCQVHTDDVALAEQHLPESAVVARDDLAGGLLVERDDGRIQIDNSLAQRLAHCWPELLPQLLDDLRTLVEHHAAAQSATAE
ncbi:MAG: V-type ATP synthase subunit E [Desulfuromonadales bacterium]|nr:V-type ATP synthase subunit E [Desulfuromonadales bacterium]